MTRPLVSAASGVIKCGGLFCLEFGQGQADAVREQIEHTGAFEDVKIINDHQGIERAAVASRKK